MRTNREKLLGKLGGGVGADAVTVAKSKVNAAAEEARWAYVPPGHQSSVYQNKADEALVCQAVVDAAGTPVANDFPYLKAEIDITIDPDTSAAATTVAGVATAVLAKRTVWLGTIDPAIEGTRQALQKSLDDLDIEGAGTTAAARQIAADAFRTIEAAVATALGV